MNWYRKAAEQGDASAQFSLAVIYDEGEGVQQDNAQAAKWYRKAADQNDSTAQLVLGNMYYDGRGVPQDYVQAYEWLNLSAAQGYLIATNSRDLVAKHMTAAQIAEAQKLTRDWLAASEARKRN
jgi:hypothetical protein